MNPRVSLLALFAILFAAAWSQDGAAGRVDSPQAMTSQRHDARRVIAALERISISRETRLAGHEETFESASLQRTRRESVLDTGDESIQVPADVEPGDFLIVGQDGTARLIRLTDCELAQLDLAGDARAVSRPLFIRIEDQAEPTKHDVATIDQRPAQSASVDVRQCRNCLSCLRRYVALAGWRCDGFCNRMQRRVAASQRKMTARWGAMLKTAWAPFRGDDRPWRLSFGEPEDTRS